MYKILRSILFLFDPEKVHYFTTGMLRFLLSLPGGQLVFRKLYVIKDASLKRTVFGLDFDNPIGLAAGFDKDGTLFNNMAYCGFGFIEIGTVTPKPQGGNDKPRLFRLKEDEAILNRMGFNNKGLEEVIVNLKERKTKVIIGGNIGKNKLTSNEDAISDYVICFKALHPHVDYFVINVSSPNTPNLRDLQDKEPLTALLQTLKNENLKQISQKPILLKIAPDLTDSQLDDIIEIIDSVKIDGVIASNTTISRANLKTREDEVEKMGAGGISGKPIRNRSTQVIRYLSEKSRGSFPIIGVGGIHSAEDALEKLDAGASLVQIYTGFIYEGPGLIKRINKELIKRSSAAVSF